MLRLADNPPLASPHPLSAGGFHGRWWVAHTRARAEKAFAFDLLARDIGYFLPMVHRVRVSGGRKRHVLLPLFTSYVFFSGDERARHTALTTGRLCQVIPVANQDALVAELRALECAIRGGARLDPFPSVAIGERYRVVAGPFRGLEGIVVRQATGTRLVLQVEMLGQGASMEIDADLLELTASHVEAVA